MTLTAGTFTLSSQGVYGGVSGTVVLNLDGTPLASVNATVLVNRTSATQTILSEWVAGDSLVVRATLTNVESARSVPQRHARARAGRRAGEPAGAARHARAEGRPDQGHEPLALPRRPGERTRASRSRTATVTSFAPRPASPGGSRSRSRSRPARASTLNFTGQFSLAVNTTTAAFSDQFVVGGQSVTLSLPAGPYLRIEGSGLEFSFQGQLIRGDFVFEKAVSAGRRSSGSSPGTSARRSGTASRASSPFANGTGALVLKAGGFGGELSGNVTVAVPGVTLTGQFAIAINTSGSAITDTIAYGAQPGTTNAVVLGDVNGDLRPDLLLGTNGGVDTGTLLYFNDGDDDPFDSLPALILPSSSGYQTKALALADLDRDGDLDLVIGNAGANKAYANDGHGVFTLTTATLGSGATALAVGDVDGDGLVDVVVGKAGGTPELYSTAPRSRSRSRPSRSRRTAPPRPPRSSSPT